MTLAAAYIILVCGGWSPGMIMERNIDGRAVYYMHWWDAPEPHMAEWVRDGWIESTNPEQRQVFVKEYPGDCQIS